ncbi:hypothetical protein CAPTEDRAFT_144642 [Capitella teleta]|uniref:nicotinamidase n=1 Tax=Capitella teleta TaxID=283909 RepID=R7TN08_CAPTE|nr:hypothetical protein CAPTEDRAFT_144642 [Capitella teleta]|eukprot:ELT95024.1 hypothetical protein CAPTEDRAFT_144642 [Capitella teleta]
MKTCFDVFDADRDGFLNETEFTELQHHLFRHRDGFHAVSDKQRIDIMKLLDEKQDGKIDREEFQTCWLHWLRQILEPKSALVIVDVQNDFISGTMSISNCPAKQDGNDVIPIINRLLENVNFECVVYSADWHPANHISFIENIKQREIHHTSKVTGGAAKIYDTVIFSGPPIMDQKMWPCHCVQDSWGARYHPDLKVVDRAIHITKGTNPDIDSYSAFWDNKKLSQTNLVCELTQKAITDVYVCGLAYDVCVGSTAVHSIEHGFRTVLIDDASRGVELADINAMKQKLIKTGAVIVDSDRVADMVDATDRRPELGYQAALNVAMARKLVKEEESKKQASSNGK